MGLFDFLKGGKGKDGEKKSPASKWAEALTKRAQAYDRQEAINELIKMKNADAAEALLKRFTFASDPSITDQEEKEQTCEGIVAIGKEAIEPVRAFAATAESLAWPTKIFKSLMTEEELVDELLAWLSKWDTEYSKFTDPKLQILATLEDYENPKIAAAVEPFLKDFTEQARFHAVGAVLAQKSESSVPALVDALIDEESVRTRNKIADGLAANGWTIPEDKRAAFSEKLTPGYGLNAAGVVVRR